MSVCVILCMSYACMSYVYPACLYICWCLTVSMFLRARACLMYACVYPWVCRSTYMTWPSVCVCVCIHVRVFLEYVQVNMHLCSCDSAYMHALLCARIVYACTHAHVCRHVRACACLQHVYMHVCMCILLLTTAQATPHLRAVAAL